MRVSAASSWWLGGELAARQDYGHVDGGSVDLALVHVGNGRLGIGLLHVEDVCCTAIRALCLQ